jgi:glycosyltransferase involved in cell wall biosynthesis
MGYFNIDPTPIPSEPRLVFVGRLTRLKAPDLLIESLSRLHQEGVDFHLTIAGDGDMRSELLSMITRHGLTQKVTMLGYCDENGVRDQILAARALVLPSFSEGLPVVLMEALALERPVVSTYIAGIPELVLPGRNGWLVPAGSIEALTVALRDVLSSPVDRLATMGRAGRASVESRHNVAKSGQLLADLFVKANNKCE